MVAEAESHADEARTLKELADTKNLGETLAYQTEKALKENREALDESVAATIEGRIMELRQAVEGADVADIQAKTNALQEASRTLADAVYAQATAAAQSQPSGNGDSAASDDEVVEDADFEVIDEEEEAKRS